MPQYLLNCKPQATLTLGKQKSAIYQIASKTNHLKSNTVYLPTHECIRKVIFNHIIVASDFLYTPIPSHSELEYILPSPPLRRVSIKRCWQFAQSSSFFSFSREHLKYKVIMMKYFVYNSTHVRFYKRLLDMHIHKRHGVSCICIFSCFI